MSDENKLWMGLNAPQLAPSEIHVGIVGAPYDGSVTHELGAAHAPEALREISADTSPHTENHINLRGLRIRDFGDAEVDQDDALTTQKAIARAVTPLVEAGAIPLVIGGDHSGTSAAVSAFASRNEMGILWIDAHPDLMDSFKGIKGREESKWNHACPRRRICELPNVCPENVLLFGIRDLLAEELDFIREEGIEVIYARDLCELSLDTLVGRIHKKFQRVPEVYVSFDIDVLDAMSAPGTGIPVPGGISPRYLYDLLFRLLDREREYFNSTSDQLLRIAGFDVVEVSPPLDLNAITSLTAMGIITAMLGYICLQEGLPTLDF
ncbi:MAG: arginase family protein [Candidatus Bipolaricaulota bacterium]|nr:arginase family protein [Candidatus Bipolaricaulota bacterium]